MAVRSDSVKLKLVPHMAVWVPGLKMWRGFMAVRWVMGMRTVSGAG